MTKSFYTVDAIPGAWIESLDSQLDLQTQWSDFVFKVLDLWSESVTRATFTGYLLAICLFGMFMLSAFYSTTYFVLMWWLLQIAGFTGYFNFTMWLFTAIFTGWTTFSVLLLYWFPHIVFAFANLVLEQAPAARDRMQELARNQCATITKELNMGYRRGLPAIEIKGQVVTLNDVPLLIESDPAAALAVTTTWGYRANWATMYIQVFFMWIMVIWMLLRPLFRKLRWIIMLPYELSGLLLALITLAVFGDIESVASFNRLAYLVIMNMWQITVFFTSFKTWREARELSRFVVLFMAVRATRYYMHVELIMRRYEGKTKGPTKTSKKIAVLWKSSFLAAQRFVDDIQLPEFIRKMPDAFDARTLEESNQIWKDLGWVEPVRILPKEDSPGVPFNDWLIAGIDLKTGIKQIRTYTGMELGLLRDQAPLYYRSESYQSKENELDSLSRYFSNPEYDFPDIKVDDVWQVVGDIFRESRLTPFEYIIRRWEKRYALGPLWKDEMSRRPRKLSRRKAIIMMGGLQKFKKIWAETFKYAQTIVPVNGVSIKGESLPLKKYLANAVRTVISAPLAHYISSTVWNYWPNHNFKYKETPIKIGMPLNGANLGALFRDHARYDVHFAGDFSAFDSTLSGKILELVAGVRKKGFVNNRHFARICWLVDSNYKNLKNSPLARTSEGTIHAKGVGLTTGHSSTGMDNSLALVTIYLMAWSEITGLSAHEFKYHNKLSNYGDDHLLSWFSTAPASWNKENIMKVTKKWGLTLRDEAPHGDLMRMEFLSKFPHVPNTQDLVDLALAGVEAPAIGAIHSRNKLLGKMYAPVRTPDPRYKAKRLISYLSLTAHHPDIYETTLADIKAILGKHSFNVPIPTYSEVLRSWYNEKESFKMPHEDMGLKDEDPEDYWRTNETFVDYTAHEFFHIFTSLISIIPDVLNPAIYNAGYIEAILSRFGKHLVWPVELIRRQNAIQSVTYLAKVLKRTPYEFLGENNHLARGADIKVSTNALLVRHWLFSLFKSSEGKFTVSSVINTVSSKVNEAQFALTGRVNTYQSRLWPDWWNIGLVVVLDFVPEIEAPAFIRHIVLPQPSILIDQAISYLNAQLWSSVPTNFRTLRHHLKIMDDENPYVTVEAPTGSGKSTAMVAMVWADVADTYEKFIIVVPRRLLAIGISEYMKTKFGLDCTPCTSNYPFNENARVIYATSGELFQHEEWALGKNLYMVDECHISEPLHDMAKRYLCKLRKHVIFASATPEEIWGLRLAIPVASVWSIERTADIDLPLTENSNYGQYVTTYLAEASGLISAAHPATRFLVFVVDKADCTRLSNLIDRNSCILSSDQTTINAHSSVFIATSVADVGLTIPDVDWVLTSDVGRTVIANGLGSSTSYIHKIDASTIRQRRGRTGRTCNGRFTLAKAKGDFFTVPPPQNDRLLGAALLASGTPPNIIAKFLPGYITMTDKNKAYDRDDDGYIDLWASNYTNATKELEAGSGISSFRSSGFDLGDNNQGDAFITHTNTMKSGLRTSDGKLAVLSPEQMSAFLNWSVGYASKRGKSISSKAWRWFFRDAAGINGREFKKRFDALGEPDGFPENSNDEHARYAKGGPAWIDLDQTELREVRNIKILPGAWEDELKD